MKITPLEIRSVPIKKGMMGYDVKEVDAFRELSAEALEEAFKEITDLEDRLKDAATRLEVHVQNEKTLKDAITTAQRIMDDIRANAKKEAELLVAEAKCQGDEIVRQAQSRAIKLQEEIFRLKKQRQELESSIKSIIDYHSGKLLTEEEESKRADENNEKLRFMPK